MTTFDDIFSATARPVMQAMLGEQGTYTAPGGSPTVVTGIAGPERVEESHDENGRTAIITRTFMVSTDASDGIPSPVESASVQIDSVDYSVTGIEHKSGTCAILNLQRRVPTERSKRGYRGRS